jgi:glycerol-3-phosphate dehydrogenase
MPMFSSLLRKDILHQLRSQTFDLLVIGGGVTGVGIALDAAQRGLKVALVEKQDFAAGTSSRSTKLIHGGLRYLKQFEFALVREVGLEREIVHHNAPHIVIPEKMLLPIIKGGSLGKLPASIGLYVYDMLAGVRRKERRTMLALQATKDREPLLNQNGLLAGALYWEYRSDDARLVTELAKTAAAKGALLLNYCAVNELSITNNKVSGATVCDATSGESFQINATRVVNAAGPWVDTIRSKAEEIKGKRLHLTKGIHLVFDHERLPIRQSVYFDVEDGRMIFAIPRDGCTYVGTTDTNGRFPASKKAGSGCAFPSFAPKSKRMSTAIPNARSPHGHLSGKLPEYEAAYPSAPCQIKLGPSRNGRLLSSPKPTRS